MTNWQSKFKGGEVVYRDRHSPLTDSLELEESL
jgi:hypothetical protein